MSGFCILLAAVAHNKATVVSDAAKGAGSSGGTVLYSRSISPSAIANALGFGERKQDIVVILCTQQERERIFCAVHDACKKQGRGFGFLCAIEADALIKTGTITGALDANDTHKGDDMAGNKQSLILVILNRGYADDAMAAARKAGAGGGTVINARGTAREDDAKFFGVHIVPEKEMLAIVVSDEQKSSVLEAIRTLPCLQEPGSGIAFCAPVDSFCTLGKARTK